MLLLDVNVLVAAFRADHPDHPLVRAWFDATMTEGTPISVPAGVWASFLRIVTNRRIFMVPADRSQAFAFVEAVSALPQHLAVHPGPRHLALLRRVCDEADATGDLVPDAVLAALALEHGLEVVTMDRDFARFSSVAHRRLPQ